MLLYNKEQSTILKLYIDEQRYNRVISSFDYKLTIFYNIYKRSGLLPDSYIAVFLIILKGLTLSYFFNSNLEE